MHACMQETTMATPSLLFATLLPLIIITLNFHILLTGAMPYPLCSPITKADDRDLVQVALNLEFLEAEFYLHSALGKGLDSFAPWLTEGGPPPIGARKANLDGVVNGIIADFGYQEIGHIRAIFSTTGGFPRPLVDLSAHNFATIFNMAVGYVLEPPFDPYLNTINYLLATYIIPYVGLVGYVGTIPFLETYTTRRLVAGLLGVEGGQDAVIRTLLYERAHEEVRPYNKTVAEFTVYLSQLRNRLAKCGIKDEGLVVPLELGSENRTEINILSADFDSLSYDRTPQEIFRIVYGTGNEHKPGGFYPRGGNGRIARELLAV